MRLDGLADDQAQAARGFERARMGLRNSHAAISYALKHIQGVDSTRLFAVGHSSGTIALQTAEYDPRIRACVVRARLQLFLP
jgi:dienelactone hydrolase